MVELLIGRFKLAPAPAGLRLAQDLVNTTLVQWAGDPERDQLADVATSREWLARALQQWSEATGLPAPRVKLASADLPVLRDLRERLREMLRASAENAEPTAKTLDQVDATQIQLTATTDGRITYEPLGTGWQAVAALISIEALLAQTAGTWTRLKTCAHPPCGACFYDASPNRSRAWHDTKTCGNINNLRASRTRRR